MPLVSLSEIRKAFSGVPALSGASLQIEAGEVMALIGQNGAGKSTMIKILTGAHRRDSGEISFDGHRVDFPTPAAAQAAGISTIYQGINLIPYRSVAENIYLGAEPRRFAEPIDAIREGIGFCTEDRKTQGIVPEMSVRENLTLALLPKLARGGIVDEQRQRAIVDDFIKRLDIKVASPDQKMRELSGGNQQKVLLARWLCMNPRLLIVDEPTRGIDVGAKAEILKLMRGLAEEGLGVLMISSELEEILTFADRITVLSDGRSVATFDAASATENGLMAAMAHTEPLGALESEAAAS